MENAIKALEIAAGVLLGVIIISLVAYFFSRMSIWPQEEEYMETAEQLAKFNLEYEVYDKKGMYGADVISCLTKAQSNNEKYVAGEKFLAGNRYGEQYWINVFVDISTPLEESLEVFYYARDINGVTTRDRYFADDPTQTGEPIENLKAANIKMGKDGAGFIFNSTYTNFTEDTKLDVITTQLTGANYITPGANIETHNGKYYCASLFLNNKLDPSNPTPLQDLVKHSSSDMKQTVNNRTGNNLDIWCTAVWTTALYDFKTKRFKCDDILYSDVTGRVNAIYFSEI